MLRKCFLTGSVLDQVTPIYNWYLPGLPKKNIGFSICEESGMIMQSPCPTPKEIENYYQNTATYINPGRDGCPSPTKVSGLKRLISLCKELMNKWPGSVFQVGCSDGYTLSEFSREGSDIIEGIDPSKASSDIAKSLYNIETKVGCFEDFSSNGRKFELLILTHVLEHLFDPLNILLKCNNMQDYDGHLLLEVPLFENESKFPPGMLTLEHLNYFSEGTIIETLTRANYCPIFVGKYFSLDVYPVITILAKKERAPQNIKSNDYKKNLSIFKKYLHIEQKNWELIDTILKSNIKRGDTGYVFGAGIHTSQLLAFSTLEKIFKIKGIIDNSPTKWGKKFGKFDCFKLENINLCENDKIIISSYASENEIYKGLSQNIKNEIICLYKDR